MRALLSFAFVALVPVSAFAQAAIAGVVKDASSAVLTYNNTFVPGGAWMQPLAIMTPRFLRITVECTF